MTQTTIEHITPVKARELLTQKQIQVIDVRTPEEYNTQHLPNAININFYSPNFQDQLTKLDRTKTYLVHCRSGGRSTKTVEIMSQLQFRYLYNVQGFLFLETQ
jgi:rhodanese-related sulfurtransferase